jgi:ATP-dependent DNA helicase RecG
MLLGELQQSVSHIKGVGSRIQGVLEKLNIKTIAELLYHYPRDYIDRTSLCSLNESLQKKTATCYVKVIDHDFIGQGKNMTLKVYVEDSSTKAALLCFGRNFLINTFKKGTGFLITGQFHYRYGEIQISNFDYQELPDPSCPYIKILPVYPLTAGIGQAYYRTIVKNAFDTLRSQNLLDKIQNEIPQAIIQKNNFLNLNQAILNIHFPESFPLIEKARAVLSYTELFYLLLILRRKSLKKRMQRKTRESISFQYQDALLKRLPFSLTRDQEKVLKEIEGDLFSSCTMARLLQGDVGCGKTLVAFVSALSVIESGDQVAFMAPTELLAVQHSENAARLLEPLGMKVALLTGSVTGSQRELLLKSLSQGDIDILIGTHALFSEDVIYRSLGLVIVDEQHRFGVLQRLSLAEKGLSPDILLMTATPIPRTLALTVFGDMDISTIVTMPAGRKSVRTHLTSEGNEQRVYERVRRELDAGRQAYFIYPLIEESAKLDIKHAEGMYKYLCKKVFPDKKLVLIHSRIDEEKKRKRMTQFSGGEVDILVATSVVEVGVDIPNAACMVIEHAERFGLSALHQLRGRVGRGKHQSYAFLIYGKKLTDNGIKRLKIMKETSDGFAIAEEDLKIRGPGELLGLRQSGYLRLKIADFGRDLKLLLKAKADVDEILKNDPGLLKAENGRVREVLMKAPPFKELMEMTV